MSFSDTGIIDKPGMRADKNFVETNLFLFKMFEQNTVNCMWGFSYLHLHQKKFKCPRQFLYCILNL